MIHVDVYKCYSNPMCGRAARGDAIDQISSWWALDLEIPRRQFQQVQATFVDLVGMICTTFESNYSIIFERVAMTEVLIVPTVLSQWFFFVLEQLVERPALWEAGVCD